MLIPPLRMLVVFVQAGFITPMAPLKLCIKELKISKGVSMRNFITSALWFVCKDYGDTTFGTGVFGEDEEPEAEAQATQTVSISIGVHV